VRASIVRSSLLVAVATIVVLTGCGTGGGQIGTGRANVQADTTKPEPFDYVMGTDVFPVEDPAMPEKGDACQDPSFGTTLVRLTDWEADGYQGPGIQNEYSRADPENCDGTMVVLRGNTAAWYLYRPDTGQVVTSLDQVFHDCSQEPEPRWDDKDPDVFYFLCGPELRRYDVGSKQTATLHDFSKDVPGTVSITTGSEGDASMDRRQWFFMAVDGDWNFLALVSYDLRQDKVIGIKSSGFADKIDGVSSDMSGTHAVVGYSELLDVEVLSADLETSTRLAEGSNGHCDLAVLPGGTDVLVYQNIRNDYICMSDLATGTETRLLRIPFDVNADIGLHISGNSVRTPGWVLVSTYGARQPPEGEEHSWMDEQLFMLELTSSPRVWRLAHTHCYTSDEAEGEKVYYAEAFASITRSGHRVYFGSNWGDFTADYSETYQLTLPAGWYSGVPE
jgi:hypothetical protein